MSIIGDIIPLFAFVLFLFVGMYINILVHEFGHVFAGQEVGLIPKEVVLSGIGGTYRCKFSSISKNFSVCFCLFPTEGYAEYENDVETDVSSEEWIFVCGGGPLANIVLILTLLGVTALSGWGIFSPLAGILFCSLAFALLLARRLVTFFLFPFAIAILPGFASWLLATFVVTLGGMHHAPPLPDMLYALFLINMTWWGLYGACNLLPYCRESDGSEIVSETLRRGGRMGRFAAWCRAHGFSVTILSLVGGISLGIISLNFR